MTDDTKTAATVVPVRTVLNDKVPSWGGGIRLAVVASPPAPECLSKSASKGLEGLVSNLVQLRAVLTAVGRRPYPRGEYVWANFHVQKNSSALWARKNPQHFAHKVNEHAKLFTLQKFISRFFDVERKKTTWQLFRTL